MSVINYVAMTRFSKTHGKTTLKSPVSDVVTHHSSHTVEVMCSSMITYAAARAFCMAALKFR